LARALGGEGDWCVQGSESRVGWLSLSPEVEGWRNDLGWEGGLWLDHPGPCRSFGGLSFLA
jgi:hypothetical protein